MHDGYDVEIQLGIGREEPMKGGDARKMWKCVWERRMFTDLCAKETCRCATYKIDILLLKCCFYNDLHITVKILMKQAVTSSS